jgi:multisubunit Na+/H+ antiporter MnhB subunit
MTTTEILMLIFGSVGSGIVAASAVYVIMRRMEKWKREVEPISPIPATDGKLCTSDRVGLIRGVMWGFIVLLGLMLALLILFFVKKDIVNPYIYKKQTPTFFLILSTHIYLP